jgi:hypothetical protein
MKSTGPLRRVVKREHDKLSFDWDVELTLECGHIVRRKWTRTKQRRARCHVCERSDLSPAGRVDRN